MQRFLLVISCHMILFIILGFYEPSLVMICAMLKLYGRPVLSFAIAVAEEVEGRLLHVAAGAHLALLQNCLGSLLGLYASKLVSPS